MHRIALVASILLSLTGPALGDGPLRVELRPQPADSPWFYCNVDGPGRTTELVVRDNTREYTPVNLCAADGQVKTALAKDGRNDDYVLAEYRRYETPGITTLTIHRLGNELVEIFSTSIGGAGSTYSYSTAPDKSGGLIVRFTDASSSAGNFSVLFDDGKTASKVPVVRSSAAPARLTTRSFEGEPPAGCDAEDAVEFIVEDGAKVVTTTKCIPSGLIENKKLVRDAKGRVYALIQYMKGALKNDHLLTVFRVGSSFREIYTAPVLWFVGFDSTFTYRYEASAPRSGGLRIEFHGDYDIASEPGKCCERVPYRKNMIITVDTAN